MKKVIISGYSGGMGLETAKKLSSNGYFVYGLDIKNPDVELENTKFIKTDIRDLNSIRNAFEIISKECDEIDLIISMAGTYTFNSLIEMSEEEFIKMFDINVFGVYRLNKVFVPLLKKKGKIVIISSELATTDPLPFTGLYGITKSTLEKYAYSLRMELQLLDYQVSVIRPGAVETSFIEMSARSIEEFSNNTSMYNQIAERYKKVVNGVESRTIKTSKIANLIYKIANKKKPRYVYKINRNPLLLFMTILPKRFQNWVIKKILIG